MTFNEVTVGGEIDQATNVEYRNLVFSYIGADAIGVARQGLISSTTYHNARFSIIGNQSN